MHSSNLIVAAATFVVIGAFHPIVIKTEYHLGTRVWPAFALAGLCFLAMALSLDGLPGILAAVTGCSCFWSILELFEQKARVEMGWFPKKEKTTQTGKE